MGSYASKLLARYGEEVTEPKSKVRCQEEVAPSTPVDAKKTLPIDPRSASVGIPRTPIEVNFTPPNTSRRPPNAIPMYLQKKPYLETDLDNIAYLAPRKGLPHIALEASTLDSAISHNNEEFKVPAIDVVDNSSPALSEHEAGDTPLATLRYKILGIDPRSPAADFDRTPILTPKSMIRMRARSQENLVRRDSYFELSIGDQARLSYCETTTMGNIPEVLALPDIMLNLNKAKDLDTTTETLDQYNSCSSSSDSSVETISDNESGEEITVVLNPKIKSLQDALASIVASSDGSSIEEIEDTQGISCPVDNIDRALSIATRAGEKRELTAELERKIRVWRDSVSLEITESPGTNVSEPASAQSNLNTLPNEEVMIEFDDAEITKTLKIQTINKQDGNEGNKTKKLEFGDRKNKNIEVEGKVFFPEKIFANDGKNVGQAPKVRTPLGNRSNNHSKVNGMPMKSPQQLLRGKTMSTKLHQENTPPRSMKSKLNSTQWDPDSTVLI